MDKRLVTLDIDNHIIPFAYFLISLVATIRTATMLIGGHDDLAAEGFNRIFADCSSDIPGELKTLDGKVNAELKKQNVLAN